MLLLSFGDFLQNYLKRKKIFQEYIRVSNSLDPDQDRQNVNPDLGPNGLQRLLADDKSFSLSVSCFSFSFRVCMAVTLLLFPDSDVFPATTI